MSTTLVSLEPFLVALREHAALAGAEGEVDEEEFAATTDQLRLAARLYSEEIYEKTGWDNPFYDLFDEFDTEEPVGEFEGDDYDFEGEAGYGEVRLDGGEADEHQGESTASHSSAWPRDRVQLTTDAEAASADLSDEEDDLVRVSVTSRHDFYVGDEATLVEYVRGRLRGVHPELAEDDLIESTPDAENAICELMELDAWDVEPYAAATMELAGAEVEVSYVDLTLEELEELGLVEDDDIESDDEDLEGEEYDDENDDESEYEEDADDGEDLDDEDLEEGFEDEESLDEDLDDENSEELDDEEYDEDLEEDEFGDDDFEGDDDFDDESDVDVKREAEKSPIR